MQLFQISERYVGVDFNTVADYVNTCQLCSTQKVLS